MGILREKTGEKTSKCMDVPEGCDLRLEAVDGRHLHSLRQSHGE